MSVSFTQAKTIITNVLGESDAATDTYVGQLLDMSQRNVASLHPWPELDERLFFNTSAVDSTGTVAVTNGDATVTLTSGTFPTDVASESYKFALTIGGQWYTVLKRTDSTHIELEQNYVGATDTSTSYVVYKDVYALSDTVDKVNKVWVHDGNRAVELGEQPSEQWVSAFGHFPGGAGVPMTYCRVERGTTGKIQIRLGPSVPSSVFRVEYQFRKQITNGVFALDDSRVDLVIYWAKAMAYERDHFDRYVTMMDRWPRMVAEEIARSPDVEGASIILGAGRLMDSGGYLDNLMDYGTVQL